MLKYVLLLLPSAARIWLLRMFGHQVGRDCHIGLILLDAKYIEIGDNVQIASFNIIHRLHDFVMRSGSRMNGFNWVTGATKGSFRLGANSAITRLHFFEASGSIEIGDNTIIAGRNSHFFTHGISSTELDVVRAIKIGEWCYVGSSSRFAPGSEIARGTFVGMGSVITRRFEDQYVLIAGAPATVKKRLQPTDAYFDRPFLPHDHHPLGYASQRNL